MTKGKGVHISEMCKHLSKADFPAIRKGFSLNLSDTAHQHKNLCLNGKKAGEFEGKQFLAQIPPSQ
jgi:hypothetical protein